MASGFIPGLLNPQFGIGGLIVILIAVSVWRIVAHRSKMNPKLVIAHAARGIIKQILSHRRGGNDISVADAEALLNALKGICATCDEPSSGTVQDEKRLSVSSDDGQSRDSPASGDDP